MVDRVDGLMETTTYLKGLSHWCSPVDGSNQLEVEEDPSKKLAHYV